MGLMLGLGSPQVSPLTTTAGGMKPSLGTSLSVKRMGLLVMMPHLMPRWLSSAMEFVHAVKELGVLGVAAVVFLEIFGAPSKGHSRGGRG